jgi:hypothetical protein
MLAADDMQVVEDGMSLLGEGMFKFSEEYRRI